MTIVSGRSPWPRSNRPVVKAVTLSALSRLERPGWSPETSRPTSLLQLFSAGVVLRLDLVPSEHEFLTELVDALGGVDPGVDVRLSVASFAPFISLPPTWEEFEASLGRRRRKLLGRANRKLARTHSDVQVVNAGVAELPHAMDELFRLHEARWAAAGIRGRFDDVRNRTFHLAVARECERMGWLQISQMLVDGRTVSSHFVLILDGVAYFMRSGRDVSYADYEIGHLHDRALLQEWIADGLHEADLLRGAEPYKFYWTRNYRVYKELLVVRGGGAGSVRLSMARIWLRLARILSHHHTPREFLYYVRAGRKTKDELRRMGITLRA